MQRAALALLAMAAAGCRPGIYDIDRMSDPLDKARYSCQYLLERSLATEDEKDPDGVLRKRIADFEEPAVTRDGDVVRTTWRPGQITVRRDASRHGGSCLMTLRTSGPGRHVDALELDGRPLHAGFGM